MLRSGTLRHRATFKRPSSTLDTRGGRSGDDVTLMADVPCSIEPLGGRELEQARQTVAEASHRVRLYADPERPLSALDYLEFGRRVLWIRYVKDMGERGFAYELLCEEEV